MFEDDPSQEPTPSSESTPEDFADMLATSESQAAPSPKAGDKVTGTIVQIGDVDAFVDCGGRSELPIATSELQDDKGELTHAVGDQITAHVQSSKEGMRLTLAMVLGRQGLEVLENAWRDKTPLKGTVQETNKGGFAIDLGGRRAFCPFSQIETHRVEDPEEYIGRALTFRIIELSEDGRNIVVSRRAHLEEERAGQADMTRTSLKIDDVIEGTVTRLVPFGAFVDIGGLEGLVHISQISHQRLREASSVLKVGQQIKVKVLDLQHLGEGRKERISLSLKALAEDPWPVTAQALQIGTEVQGRVTRLTEFGAFVELQPGVEGLIHISELAPRRIMHPQEIVSEGEEVSVRILDVDFDRRRISLSLKQAASQEYD